MSGSYTAADEALELLDAMDVLFNQTKVREERRGELRVPFFRPLSITFPGDSPRTVTAFSRDLSPTGIGLVHCAPIETGEAVVTVPVTEDESLSFWTEIRWVQPLGEDWYISGGRFLRVAS